MSAFQTVLKRYPSDEELAHFASMSESTHEEYLCQLVNDVRATHIDVFHEDLDEFELNEIVSLYTTYEYKYVDVYQFMHAKKKALVVRHMQQALTTDAPEAREALVQYVYEQMPYDLDRDEIGEMLDEVLNEANASNPRKRRRLSVTGFEGDSGYDTSDDEDEAPSTPRNQPITTGLEVPGAPRKAHRSKERGDATEEPVRRRCRFGWLWNTLAIVIPATVTVVLAIVTSRYT
jgi:hypothetical protein